MCYSLIIDRQTPIGDGEEAMITHEQQVLIDAAEADIEYQALVAEINSRMIPIDEVED